MTEKACTRCREMWPRDTQFFRKETRGAGYYLPWCRACEAEQKRQKRAQTKGNA